MSLFQMVPFTISLKKSFLESLHTGKFIQKWRVFSRFLAKAERSNKLTEVEGKILKMMFLVIYIPVGGTH